MKAALLLQTSWRQPSAGHFQDTLDHRIDGHPRRIKQDRVGACEKRRSGASGIAQITLRYLQRKGGKVSSNPLFFQLLITSQGPLGSARREKNLNLRPREYHTTHIPAVRHQTRGYGKAPLPLQELGADLGYVRPLESSIPPSLRPNDPHPPRTTHPPPP